MKPHTHPFRRLTVKPPSVLLQSLTASLRSPGVSWVSATWEVMFVSTEDPLRKRKTLKNKEVTVVVWRVMEGTSAARKSGACG